MAVQRLTFRTAYRCGQRSVFTNLTIAQGVDRIRARARATALREAEEDRNDALDFELFLRCPASCPANGFLENRSSRELKTFRVRSDPPTHVAYYLGRLNGYRRCDGSGLGPAVPTRTRSRVLRHRENPACGTTRSRTGCVLAESIAGSKTVAENRAEREAHRVASLHLAADRGAACPAGCGPATIGGDTAPTVRRALVTRKITQARATRYIAYAVATWKVDIRCPEKKAGKEAKKDKKAIKKKR